MWDRAKALLDQSPFYPLVRPLAGAALGLAVGGLFGALGGALHAALRLTPALFVAWFLPAAAAGTVAGFIMGVCSVMDRAGRGSAAPTDPKRDAEGEASPDGPVTSPRAPAADGRGPLLASRTHRPPKPV
jgi:hypothetical protein